MMKLTKNVRNSIRLRSVLSAGSILESGYTFIFSLCLSGGVLMVSLKPQVSSIPPSNKMLVTDDVSIHEENLLFFFSPRAYFNFLEQGSRRMLYF